MAKTLDFTNFATELTRTLEMMGGTILIANAIMGGASSLQTDFTVRKIRDKGALLSAKYLDVWKAASQSFDGRKAVEFRSRVATFTEGDIDIEITLDDIKEAYNTYIGWIQTAGRTLIEVQDNPFELFFIRDIIQKHFDFVRQKTAWKGIYSTAGVGAENIADGFIKKFTAGRAVGGDIPASNIFTGAAITTTNAYDQVNGPIKLVAANRPELLTMGMNCYMSQGTYDKYRANRRVLFKEHVGPADMPTASDDYSNVLFKVDPGLAGKDTIVVTPKENLQFIANTDPGQYRFNAVKQVKSIQINIRASVGFDYASPDLSYLNDLV